MDAVPSPAILTADALVQKIRADGGRIFQSGSRSFVLTTNEGLADWLIRVGGKPYEQSEGYYLRARGGLKEWDIYIDGIPVAGLENVREAACR
jgi:hypothetical protein